MKHGLRWDRSPLVNSIAPCMNLNKVVFGSGNSFDAWIERARESLVVLPGTNSSSNSIASVYSEPVERASKLGEGLVPRLTRMMFGSSGGMYECVSRLSAF